MLIMMIFFVIIYIAILNENMELEYIAIALVSAGLLMFSLLTVYEA